MNMPRWKVELAVLVKIVAPPPDERKIDDCNDLPVVTCVSDPPDVDTKLASRSRRLDGINSQFIV